MTVAETAVRLTLAGTFALHGLVFLRPPAAARAKMAAGPLTMPQFAALGAAELAGAVALLLPVVSDRWTALADLATVALLGVTVPATYLHARRGEWASTPLTVALSASLAGVLLA